MRNTCINRPIQTPPWSTVHALPKLQSQSELVARAKLVKHDKATPPPVKQELITPTRVKNTDKRREYPCTWYVPNTEQRHMKTKNEIDSVDRNGDRKQSWLKNNTLPNNSLYKLATIENRFPAISKKNIHVKIDRYLRSFCLLPQDQKRTMIRSTKLSYTYNNKTTISK